jgi:hypothetical protein
MFDEFFGDEPTNDSAIRAARAIGTMVGVFLYIVMTWVVLRGFL